MHFAASGSEGASYNKIIADIGVSKGAMYYYFEDKADLYRCVIADMLDSMEQAAIDGGPFEPSSQDEFWQLLMERGAAMRDSAMADEEMLALGRDLAKSTAGLELAHERAHRWIGTLLARGRTVGAVREDVSLRLLTHAVVGMMIAMDRLMLAEGENVEASSTADIFRLCYDLVSPR